MTNTEWSPRNASNWLKQYADEVAGDAYKGGGDDLLYACAGAAYYAVLHNVGTSSKDEFSHFFLTHLCLDENFLTKAIEEIENNSISKEN